jgi:Barstar (barnase inhibitor)
MRKASFFVSNAGDSLLCDYGLQLTLSDPATAVRFVRGGKMRNAHGLFDEFAAACQFPYYFGENWPALAECLGDLEWINSSKFVLIITDCDQVLADEPVEVGAFSRALAKAIEDYNSTRENPEVENSLFRLVVNCKSDGEGYNGPALDAVGHPQVLRI